jgi:hypothetical protein
MKSSGCAEGGRRCVASALTLAAIALGLAAAPALASNAACPDAASSTATSCTFTNAGTSTFTVPTSVESVDVVAAGAAGGAASTIDASPVAAGGAGASVEDTAVPVLNGNALTVIVGGVGQNAAYQGNAVGGSPGGGGAGGQIPGPYYVSGAGGGGFSGVLDASSTPLVIAGGGGGAAGLACSGGGAGGAGDSGSGGATGGQCSDDGGTGGSATAVGQAGGSGDCTYTGRLRDPTAVAVDPSNGEVFVTDAGNERVERFRPDGTFTGAWGSPGSGYGQFAGPAGIAVAPDGSFYVTDSRHNRMEKFGFPGPLSQFVIDGLASWKHTNTAQEVTLTAEDASGDVMISTYSGSPAWQDSCGQVSGSPAAFRLGSSNNLVRFANPVHGDRITVTDGPVGIQSSSFSRVGALAKFALSTPGTGSAGTAATVTISAEDSVGNVVTDHAGSPTWSDSSGQITGSPHAFSSGVSHTSVTFPSRFATT